MEAASDRLPNHISVDKEIVQCHAVGRCAVILRNIGNNEYSVQRGDASAQSLLRKPDNSSCIRIDDVDDDIEVAIGSPVTHDLNDK